MSQGITEDTSDLVSGFATIGDESINYPNEYWDSDEYEDDDDVGYMRQPIEDETWFLSHEIDYPSDNEKGTAHGSVPEPQQRGQNKDDEDDQSFAEEDSYFSGEQYFPSKAVDPVLPLDDPFRKNNENALIGQYDGQLMDKDELNLMRAEPVWQGFVSQTNKHNMLADKGTNERARLRLDDICMDDDQHGSVRSIGVGINSDAADIGSEIRESLVGGSSEGDFEYFRDHDVISGPVNLPNHLEQSKKDKNRIKRPNSEKYIASNDKGARTQSKNQTEGGFSFPPPTDGQSVQPKAGKSLWVNKSDTIINSEADDDKLATWRGKIGNSSPSKFSMYENNANDEESASSSPSSLSNYGYIEREHMKSEYDVTAAGVSLEDEEAAAVQEQVNQIKAQEEEFETFNLKIVHRKNRHGKFSSI